MPFSVTMVDPNGQEWVAGSATEVTDLRAQGYRLKGHGTAGAADQPAEQQAQQPAAREATKPADEPAKASTTVNTDQSGNAVGGGK